MKKMVYRFGMAALVLALTVAACDTGGGGGGTGGGSNPFVGTWEGVDSNGNNLALTLSDTGWECFSNHGYGWKGTYAYSGSIGIMTVTQIKYPSSGWSPATGGGTGTVSGNTLTATFTITSEDGISTTATFIKTVGGGDNGGLAWTAVGTSTFGTSFINAIAYGNGTFVAGGSGGKMAYSTDGITWTAVGTSTFGTSTIRAIAYGGGRFVAVSGDSDYNDGYVYSGKAAYSTDGITWTAVGTSTFGTTAINGIAYGDGRFVAVGESYGFRGNTYGFLGYAAYSTDGQTWTAATMESESYSAIAYGGGRFVAVSSITYETSNPRSPAAYSTDGGANWTTVYIPVESFFQGIAYGNGRFVAVGSDGMTAWSTNGQTWTTSWASTFGGSHIAGIAYGGGKFVAVGDDGKMAYSTDGQTWTAVTHPFGTSGIYGITYGGGRFVAGGSGGGKMAYSNILE
jgi:hypothetical protein